jgi:ABC-type histidine transport system ATPase subunit
VVQATKTRTIVIQVNTKPVSFPDERGRDAATGAEIKTAAIAQGVSIQPDFVLFLERGNDLDPIADDEAVHIRPNQKFRAVAPDDNS